jgi:hypothetical protein
MAVTFRDGTATFESVETMPAIVPPTGWGPVLMTGPGWQAEDATAERTARIKKSLMIRVD